MFGKKSLVLVCLFSVLIGILVSGCGGGGPQLVVENEFVAFSEAEKAQLSASRGSYYRIQESDVFDVAFTYQKELDQNDVLVLPDGSVTLVGLDRLVLAGLTITEADSLITRAYGKEYRNPDLSLIMTKTKGRQVYVMGEVKTPGLYSLPGGGIDMLGAITTAGGFTEDANQENTVVVRVQRDGYDLTRVDLSGFDRVSHSGVALVSLEPYDIVYVPRSDSGTFHYFSKTVLAGIAQLARIAADVKYLSGSTNVRY